MESEPANACSGVNSDSDGRLPIYFWGRKANNTKRADVPKRHITHSGMRFTGSSG